MRLTRRRLTTALGILWLLDGALQLQPALFTGAFARQVLAPAAAGQPGPLAWAVHTGTHLVAAAPLPADALAAAIQLTIGAGMLWPRGARVALGASVAWALGVWIVGEGAGQLLVPGASAFTGAPGAALLYVVLAVAAWPSPRADVRLAAPRRFLPSAWALLWVGFAVLELLPAQRSGAALAGDLSAGSADLPGTLAHGAGTLAALARTGGVAGPLLAALLFAAIGVGALARGGARRSATLAGALVATAIWVLPEAFGGIGTGLATDPNTGPVIVLLAWATAASTATRRGVLSDALVPVPTEARAA